eukprot:10280-Alexandrium_andersonii.AAC.1
MHAGTLIEVTSSKGEGAYTEEERRSQLSGPRTFTYNRRGDHHLITVPAGVSEDRVGEHLQQEVRACEEVTQAAYA